MPPVVRDLPGKLPGPEGGVVPVSCSIGVREEGRLEGPDWEERDGVCIKGRVSVDHTH